MQLVTHTMDVDIDESVVTVEGSGDALVGQKYCNILLLTILKLIN